MSDTPCPRLSIDLPSGCSTNRPECGLYTDFNPSSNRDTTLHKHKHKSPNCIFKRRVKFRAGENIYSSFMPILMLTKVIRLPQGESGYL